MRIRTAHANDCVSYVVRITSESHPRDARLTTRRSNGSALHTLDHQFSKSRAQKVAAQTPMLTGLPNRGQGGLTVEDTPPRPPPPRAAAPPHPSPALAEPDHPRHIPPSWSRSPTAAPWPTAG